MAQNPKIDIVDFDTIRSDNHIFSFLKNRQQAHNLNHLDTNEWFLWKFYQSPYGKAIMPSVYDKTKDEVVGGNYYGMLNFGYNQNKIKTASPYEAYVHPNYQGLGLFKNLIASAERKAIEENISLLVAFPNTKSLKGFIKNNWTQINAPITYYTRLTVSSKTVLNALDIKKPFIPEPIKSTKNSFSFYDLQTRSNRNCFYGLWTKAYLEWRFNENPVAQYEYFRDKDKSILARIGKRGKLKECQILFADMPVDSNAYETLKYLVKQLSKRCKPNIVSFPVSEHYNYIKAIKLHFPFPLKSQTNFVYKPLDGSLESNKKAFSLCGLNFHMY